MNGIFRWLGHIFQMKYSSIPKIVLFSHPAWAKKSSYNRVVVRKDRKLLETPLQKPKVEALTVCGGKEACVDF